MLSRMHRKKTWFVGMLVLALLFTMSACSKPPAQEPSKPAEKPAEGPKRGGTLTVAFGAPVLTLDPGFSVGTQAQTVRKTVFESLVSRDEAGKILPQLAERWETASDGLTWRFFLRKGVKFHDGTPFNAEAVRRSIWRLIDPEKGLPRGKDLLFIDSVRVVEEHTVEIKTKMPFGPLLAYVAMDTMSIMSPGSLDKWGEDVGWHPVGTGPFRFDSYVPEQSVTLVRNDDYWGEPAYLDKIIFKTVAEDATRVTMLEAGEADVIANLPAYQISRLKNSADCDARIDNCTRVAHLGVNMLQKPFDDVRVRQALNYAVDRPALVTGVLSGVGEVAKSIIAPATWGYVPVEKYSYNPEKAKELLKEAGFPKGLKAKLQTPQGRYFMDRETSVAVQAQMAKAGIDLEVETVDWATYLKILRYPPETNKTQLYLLGWESGTADIAILVDGVFRSSEWAPKSWNTMFYKNQKVDDLIEKSRAETDPDKRMAMCREMQETIMEDAPWVPLYVYSQITGLRNNVRGLQVLATEVFLFNKVSKE